MEKKTTPHISASPIGFSAGWRTLGSMTEMATTWQNILVLPRSLALMV